MISLERYDRMLDYAILVTLFALFLLIETYTRVFDRYWLCGVGFAIVFLVLVGTRIFNIWISPSRGLTEALNILFLLPLASGSVLLALIEVNWDSLYPSAPEKWLVIDDHLHFPGDADKVIRSMDEANVDKAILVPYRADRGLRHLVRVKLLGKLIRLAVFSPMRSYIQTYIALRALSPKESDNSPYSEARIDNSACARVVAKHPDRFLFFAWINPNRNDAVSDLRSLVEENDAAGVKLQGDSFPIDFRSGRMREIASYASKLRLPLWLHLGPKPESHNVPFLAEMCPDLIIIVGHMGKNAYPMCLKWAKQFPNVYLDVSNYVVTAPIVNEAVQEVGAEKLIMGSDGPDGGSQKFAIRQVMQLQIADEKKEMILGGNMVKLLRLHR